LAFATEKDSERRDMTRAEFEKVFEEALLELDDPEVERMLASLQGE